MKQKDTEQNETRGFFNLMLEILAWLQIVASPVLISLVIGVIIYVLKPDDTGFLISICVVSLGLIIGITWATIVWKKKGTLDYLSKVRESPEFDNWNEKD